MPLTFSDAFGIVGLVTLLGAFLANLAGRLRADGALYPALNLVGSGILAVYSVMIQAWVFFPLEAVWALAAGVMLVRKGLTR